MNQSITFFTKPIQFDSQESIIFPTKWERICMPNRVLSAILDFTLPYNLDHMEQAQKILTQTNSEWMVDLIKQGYSAVRVSLTLDDCFCVEATKEPWKE